MATQLFYAPQDSIPLLVKDSFLTVSVGGTPANNTFKWYRNNVLEATVTADTFYKPSHCGTYRVEVTNNVAYKLTLYSKAVSIINPAARKPEVHSSGTTFCEEESLLLQASGAGLFQWYRNDTLLPGATQPILTVTRPGSYVVADLESGCGLFSDPFEILMEPLPSLTVQSSATVICPGAEVTFTVTPLHAGITPLYQWKKNGQPVGSAAPEFKDHTLANGDSVWVELTASTVCKKMVTSPKMGVTVNSNSPVPVRLGNDTTICVADPKGVGSRFRGCNDRFSLS